MTPADRTTDDLLRRYLSGSVTAPEEAELERRARTDRPLADALAGLRAHPEADHAARVARLRARARGAVPRRRPAYARYAAAAAVLLLVGVAALWLPRMISPDDAVAQTAEPAPSAPERTESGPAETIDLSAADGLEPTPTSPARSDSPSGGQEAYTAPATPPSNPKPSDASKRSGSRSSADESEVITESITEKVVAGNSAPPPPVRSRAAGAESVPKLSAPRTLAPTPNAGGLGPISTFREGRVTNENGVPVVGAEVTLAGQPLGQTTDSSGVFRLPAGGMITEVEVIHPNYETESVELTAGSGPVQISLDRKLFQREEPVYDPSPGVTIDLDNDAPSFARPTEGYAALRRRLETEAPDDLPTGKYKFSFLVNLDGTITDITFRGSPPRAVMDYLGTALVRTSEWSVVSGEEPVRVYFRVRLK